MDKIETWEYSLRKFIDIATRWSTHSIKLQTYPPNSPFSSIFWPFVKDARAGFEGFKSELRDQFLQVPDPNRLETDIKDRFLTMTGHYLGWYNGHKSEIEAEGFGDHDPYAAMMSVVQSTREQIFVWFPETEGHDTRAASKATTYNDLFSAFKDPEKYQRIMNLLVTKGICSPGNPCHHWGDIKGRFVDFLKTLHIRGYLRRNLNPEEMIAIAEKFGLGTVSRSTLRSKPLETSFPFIPLSSTL